MGLKTITPAAAQIDLPTLKTHCRIAGTDTEEDTLLGVYLASAQKIAQEYTGRAVGTQTLELALDAFPTGAIELKFVPVSGIVSVKYIDTDGVEQTLADNLYVLDNYGDQNWLMPVSDTPWPSTKAVANAVKVRYNTGDFTDAVQMGVLMLVAYIYDHRDAELTADNLPEAVKFYLNPSKVRLGLA